MKTVNPYADKEKLAELKQKANRLPLQPGVYIMKNSNGEIIYIGKAKALKNRVTQYFGSDSGHTEKVKRMISNVDRFEYILCDSEFEALMLENSLIKQNQPKYNILLKDDKGYHYIKITNDKWRKLTTSKLVSDDGAEYIGPYYSGYVVKDTVDEVLRIFKLPDCGRSFDKPTKPCLNYHIGRCDAPCRGKMSLSDYNEAIDSARYFIRHGAQGGLIKEMTRRMETASENLDFELAAKLRDRIRAIERIGDRQKVVMCTYDAQDVFASAIIGETVCVGVLVFRNGKLTDKKHYFIEGVTDISECYAEFLQQYYLEKDDIPPRILLDFGTGEDEILEKWLSEKCGKKVSFIIPKSGDQKHTVEMCRANAADNLARRAEHGDREAAALSEIAALLGLDNIPRYIEAYDISNTAGDENVAGMVVYKKGKPFKQNYRKFKIKSFSGQDDFRSMAEVLDRRFCEYENGEDEAFSVLPDLILLDGGRGQMSAVVPVLEKHNISVPLFGMVKDSKHRTRAIASSGGDIAIKANRNAYTMITKIQDEVHRFAIGYHRNRRSKKMLSSELTSIKGVGEARAKELLRTFKTVSAVKQASVDELAAVKGINPSVAGEIYKAFHNNSNSD